MLLVLKSSFVALVTAGLAAGLARSARLQSGGWPVTSALLLGNDAGPDALGEAEVDLRFRAFLGGVLLVVAAALAFPELVRSSSAGRLVLAVVVVLPVVTLALAAAADLAARAAAAVQARVAAAEGVQGSGDDASLDDLLEEARLELREATARVSDAHLHAALEALREALDEYALADAEDTDGEEELRARVRGVAALARTCAEAEGHDAARLLGVRPDADPAQAATVCRALLPVYRGAAALPGTDPSRAAALEAAAAHLARRAA